MIEAIITDAQAAGVTLFVDNGRLAFDAPAGGVPQALLTRIRGSRLQLIERLSVLGTAQSAPQNPKTIKAVFCPWCRSTDLADSRAGLACGACGREAYRGVAGGLARCDLPDWDEADPIEQPVCKCGQPMQAMDSVGIWHCNHCEPERRRRTFRTLAQRKAKR